MDLSSLSHLVHILLVVVVWFFETGFLYVFLEVVLELSL